MFTARPEETQAGYRPDFSTGRAYVETDHDVPPALRDYLGDLLEGFSEQSVTFIIHVLVSAIQDRDGDGWVPIPNYAIRNAVPKADREKERLMEAGSLVRTAKYGYGKCYEYRVSDEIMERATEILFEEALNCGQSVSPTGELQPREKRKQTGPKKTHTTDPNGTPYRDPLLGALRVWKSSGGLADFEAIKQHLRATRLANKALKERITSGLVHSAMQSAVLGEYQRRQDSLANDAWCFAGVCAQRPKPAPEFGEGVFEYVLAYTPTSTGRLSHHRGGLQSCSRPMKAAAYRGIPGVQNYDIVASQAVLLANRLRQDGFDSGWLDTYIATEKRHYAEEAGVSVTVWKTGFYAVVFGASLISGKTLWGQRGAVHKAIAAANQRERVTAYLDAEDPDAWIATNGVSSVDTAEPYRRVRAALQPLLREVTRWREWLAYEWLDDNRWRNSKAGRSIRNRSDAQLTEEVFDSWGKNEEKRQMREQRPQRLAAFLLQGDEAAYIHTLTAMLPGAGVRPIANEHDGLVVLGEIPRAVEQKAGETTGLVNLRLEPKELG